MTMSMFSLQTLRAAIQHPLADLLPTTLKQQMADVDLDGVDTTYHPNSSKGLTNLSPLLQLYHAFFAWAEALTNGDPFLHFPVVSGFTDLTAEESDKIYAQAPRFQEVLTAPTEELKVEKLSSLISDLGVRGILTMLHLRKTPGSVDVIPPHPDVLLQAFNRLHLGGEGGNNKKVRLTVGGRAWAKHAHRCQQGFWGVPSGSESAKSLQAELVLRNLMDSAVWLNWHGLPGDQPSFEIRNLEGYGARWVRNEKEELDFRGFLEPQMEDGHTRGWRH